MLVPYQSLTDLLRLPCKFRRLVCDLARYTPKGSYYILYALQIAFITLTASVVVHGVALVTLTPEPSIKVDTPGPLALTLLTCALHVALVDVTMTLVPCPPRHAHAARDDVTVAGSGSTGTDVAAVGTVGSRGTSLREIIRYQPQYRRLQKDRLSKCSENNELNIDVLCPWGRYVNDRPRAVGSITVQLYIYRFCHHCPALPTDTGHAIVVQLYLLT